MVSAIEGGWRFWFWIYVCGLKRGGHSHLHCFGLKLLAENAGVQI